MKEIKKTNHSWGVEILWCNNKQYSGRFFVIREGESTPFGYYKKSDKTIFVLQGLLQLILEKQTKLLQPGEAYHLPQKMFYQLCAIKGDATVLECGTESIDDFVKIK